MRFKYHNNSAHNILAINQWFKLKVCISKFPVTTYGQPSERTVLESKGIDGRRWTVDCGTLDSGFRNPSQNSLLGYGICNSEDCSYSQKSHNAMSDKVRLRYANCECESRQLGKYDG